MRYRYPMPTLSFWLWHCLRSTRLNGYLDCFWDIIWALILLTFPQTNKKSPIMMCPAQLDHPHHVNKWLLLFCIQYWTHASTIHLCQNELSHGVWCSRWCWKDLWLVEDLHLCDSKAHGAFPPFFNPPPPIPPNHLTSGISGQTDVCNSCRGTFIWLQARGWHTDTGVMWTSVLPEHPQVGCPPISYVTLIMSERNDTLSMAKPQSAC
jgi:hypothetical protein